MLTPEGMVNGLYTLAKSVLDDREEAPSVHRFIAVGEMFVASSGNVSQPVRRTVEIRTPNFGLSRPFHLLERLLILL